MVLGAVVVLAAVVIAACVVMPIRNRNVQTLWLLSGGLYAVAGITSIPLWTGHVHGGQGDVWMWLTIIFAGAGAGVMLVTDM